MLTQRNDEPGSAYRPFDKTRDGLAIAEVVDQIIAG